MVMMRVPLRTREHRRTQRTCAEGLRGEPGELVGVGGSRTGEGRERGERIVLDAGRVASARWGGAVRDGGLGVV